MSVYLECSGGVPFPAAGSNYCYRGGSGVYPGAWVNTDTGKTDVAVEKINNTIAVIVSAAVEEAQLIAKKQMLESDTAQWSSQEAYTSQIDSYNDELRITDTVVAESMKESITESVKKSAMIPLLIIAGVLVAIAMYVFKRD